MLKYFCLIALLTANMATQADHWNSRRPDSHAPIGVMGDHTHKAGEWMWSYRYKHMAMRHNRNGSSRISDAEVLNRFMVTPADMRMDMHMFGGMYAPSERLTLMAMVPFIDLSMNHLTRAGDRFRTHASGLGDLQISGLYVLRDVGQWRAHLNLGLSLPTGSIDEKGDTPMGANQPLPYPMQLGSGTYDLLPGITFLGQVNQWSWGSQATAIFRLGENDNRYTLGNRLDFTVWLARTLFKTTSGSMRFAVARWGNIDGADPRLNRRVVPTADSSRRGGTRLNFLVGLNWQAQAGLLTGNRLAVEIGAPLYQHLDGPQLGVDWSVTVGWQYAF